MEEKYRRWHKIQIISSIIYAVFMIWLLGMIYAESSYYTLMIIIAVIATVSLMLTVASGLIRAFIGYKMGIKSTKKDWLIVAIAIILVIIYFAVKHL